MPQVEFLYVLEKQKLFPFQDCQNISNEFREQKEAHKKWELPPDCWTGWFTTKIGRTTNVQQIDSVIRHNAGGYEKCRIKQYSAIRSVP